MARTIASKVYRPEGISVAKWDISGPDWGKALWPDGSNLKVEGFSEFEQLQNRKLLRAGEFDVRIEKRRGHLMLFATV